MRHQAALISSSLEETRNNVAKMDEIAAGQSADMRASITESTRAAGAMENIANAMAVSAEAAQKSADTAAAQFAVNDRAWLSVDVQIDGPLVNEGTTITVPIRMNIKNVGRS